MFINFNFFFSFSFGGLTYSMLTQTYFVAKDDLDFLIFLPPFPHCWDEQCVTLCLVYAVLKVEPRGLPIPGKYFTN